MFLIPLAAVLMCPGLTTEPTITFSQPAMTLGRLLPKLGEAAGVKMEADKSIKNEVVLVQVKDVPVKDLMSRIAKAACGEWEAQDGTQVLKLNRDQDRAERTADWKRKVASLQARILKVGDKVGMGSTPRKEHFGNGDQALYRILRMVHLETMAGLGEGDTVVFAYPPRGSQFPLPAECMTIAHDILSKTPNRQPGELAKVVIDISKSIHINLTAKLVREDGTVMTNSFLSIYDDQEQDVAKPIKLPKPDAQISIPENRRAIVEKVGLFAKRGQFVSWSWTSSESFSSITFAEQTFNPSEYTRLSAEQDEILHKPDIFDPLSIGLGDSLGQFAETQDLNLVACLPDSAGNKAYIDLGDPAVSATTLAQRLTKWGLDVEVDGAWCTVRPDAPSEARASRLNRTVLRNMIDQAGYQKLPSLERVSGYCAAQPLIDPAQSFEMTWLRMNCPETAKSLYRTVPDRCLLKFWGLLGPALRVKLAMGGSINLAGLTMDQKSILAKAMPRMDRSVDPQLTKQEFTPDGIPIVNVANDYSEIVPPIASMQADLIGSSTTRDVLLGISENGERSVFDFTKESRLNMSLMRDSLNFEQFVIQAPRVIYPYYQPGQRTSVKLVLRVLNPPSRIKTLSFTHFLYDNRIPVNASLIKRSDLPDHYLKWLNKQLGHLQELEQKLDIYNRQEKRS